MIYDCVCVVEASEAELHCRVYVHTFARSLRPSVSNTRQTRRMTESPPPPSPRSQSSLRPQLGLPATPSLGPQQRVHLARVQLGGARSSGAPSGADGGGKTEALSRSRLDGAHRQRWDWVCFNMHGVADVLPFSSPVQPNDMTIRVTVGFLDAM